MESLPKVLIVDKSIDRKTRISAIKARGFAVFPALNLQEARSRCRPGAYDLVVVNGTDEPEASVAFCEHLRDQKPSQAVVLTLPEAGSAPAGDYVVSNDPTKLADKIESLLRSSSGQPEVGDAQGEEMPARASA